MQKLVKYAGSVDELFALTQASKGEDFDLFLSIQVYSHDTMELDC